MSPKSELDRLSVESRGAHSPLSVYVRRRRRHAVCPDQNVAATYQLKEMQQHFSHSGKYKSNTFMCAVGGISHSPPTEWERHVSPQPINEASVKAAT